MLAQRGHQRTQALSRVVLHLQNRLSTSAAAVESEVFAGEQDPTRNSGHGDGLSVQAWVRQTLDGLEQNVLQADSATYARLLEACGDARAIPEGRQVHSRITRSGMDRGMFLGDLLVRMYLDFGNVADAQAAFDRMHVRDAISWARMIRVHAQSGDSREAFRLFRQMQLEGVMPVTRTFVAILNACSSPDDLAEGRRIHSIITGTWLEYDAFVGTTLLHMYGKCRSLADARNMFSKLHHKRVVSWNAMITAYAQQGHYLQAVQLFHEMQLEGIRADNITFVGVIDACANLAELNVGSVVHACIEETGAEADVIVVTALINMYGNCGALGKARETFSRHEPDMIMWTSMITACAQQGCWQEALHVFKQMQLEGLRSDRVAFMTILNACSGPRALPEGRLIHACIVESQFQTHVRAANALVNMYGKCGSLDDALTTFNSMQQKDVISWNTMIAAYGQHARHSEALQLLRQMQLEGVKPDRVTFVNILPICATLTALREGKMIHLWILESGLESDLLLGNAIIDMYGSCKSPEDASRMFNSVPFRDLVAWNAMIAAYAQPRICMEALLLFQQMQLDGVMPDKITFVGVLSACAIQASLAEGKLIHNRIIESGLEEDISVGNAIINMYGKSGNLLCARQMFDKMPERDVVSWNGMIATYAQHGHADEVLRLFRRMHQESTLPNDVTFVSVLSACSHAGLLEDGAQWFFSLVQDHGIPRKAEHYNCMIDLLARAGKLEDAEKFIKKMPFKPDNTVWSTLLGACKVHRDVERAKRTAEQLMELSPERSAAYVVLSNLYAEVGRKDEAAKLRRLMLERNVRKEPGCSSIAIKRRVHEFYMGDTSHPQMAEIFVELERLNLEMKKAGYLPDTKLMVHDVGEHHKEQLLSHHSEKLAIAYGLISTPSGTPLRIIKNLRVCEDCHTAGKFISKIAKREIIVRDAHRFHHFENGVCSCGDYW